MDGIRRNNFTLACLVTDAGIRLVLPDAPVADYRVAGVNARREAEHMVPRVWPSTRRDEEECRHCCRCRKCTAEVQSFNSIYYSGQILADCHIA